jgi:hypothetical protein
VWRKIQQINKALCSAATERFREFHSIPYMLENEQYTELQKKMIVQLRQHFQYHSSWFLSLCRHNCVDLVDCYTGCDTRFRKRCEELKCPGLCCKQPDDYDSAILLSKRINSSSNFRQEILENLNVVGSFLPYLMYRTDLSETIHHMGIIQKSNSLSRPLSDSVGDWIIPQLPKPQQFDSNAVFTRYEIYLAADGGQSINFEANAILANYVNADTVEKIRNAFRCVKMILYNPDVQVVNAYRSITPLVELPVFIGGTMLEMTILTIGDHVIKLNVIEGGKIRIYLLITSGWMNAYIVSYCAKCITTLSKVKIVIPKVIIGESGTAMLILPPGATEVFNPADLSAHYKGLNGSPASMAIFVVSSYLLGIDTKYVLVSDDGLLPVDYRILYKKDKIRLGQIITAMGGRSSKLYKEFVGCCTGYYIKFRSYYKHVVALMTILGVRREIVDARFMPTLSDVEAIKHIESRMAECGDYAVRSWKYLGY